MFTALQLGGYGVVSGRGVALDAAASLQV